MAERTPPQQQSWDNRGARPAVGAAVQPEREAGEPRAGAQPRPVDRPSPGPSLRAVNGDTLDQQACRSNSSDAGPLRASSTPVQGGERPRPVVAAHRRSRVKPWDQQQRRQRHGRARQQDGLEAKPLPDEAALRSTLAPPAPPSPLAGRVQADKALLVAMLRCPSWTHLPALMQSHEEQHLEVMRQAAVAAVAVVAAASTSAASEGASPSTCSSGGATVHLVKVGDEAVSRRQLQSSPAGAPVSSSSQRRASDPGYVQQQQVFTQPPLLHQPPPHQQHPAFTPRHLATALHVTSLRVPEPRELSHADRVRLGEFLRSLGHGCAGLAARDALPPVDLAMALRALARLLGDAATSPAGLSLGASGRGGDHRSGEMYGVGAGLISDDYDDSLFAAGSRRRLGAHALGDDYDEEVDEGWAPRGSPAGTWGGGHDAAMRRGPSAEGVERAARGHRGGLYAAWLDEAWVDRMLEPTLDAFWHDFEPRHISGILWALATLDIRPRPDLLSALCERAAECAEVTVAAGAAAAGRNGNVALAGPSGQAFTSQGLSLTLWALARLGFHPGPSALDVMLRACELDMRAAAAPSAVPRGAPGAAPPLVQPCCSLDLAQRAWALASLGFHPGEEWLELLVAAFLTRGSVEQISGQSCSMAMWALAKLHALGPPSSHDAASASGAASSPPEGDQLPSPSAADGESSTGGSDADMGNQELLRARADSGKDASTSGRSGAAPVAAWASAGCGSAAALTSPEADLETWVSGSGFAGGVAEAAIARGLGFQNPSAEAAEASADGSLRAAWPRRPGRIRSLLGLLQGALGRMSSQHLATVLWALSSMGVRPSQAWLEAFLDATGRRMNAALTESQPFGPQSLAMLLGAVAKLRYRPPAPWMHRFIEVCRKELSTFGPHAACVLAWALVRLSYKPRGEWRAAFARTTQPLLPDMPPLGLCILLWALASWRSRPPRAWLQAAFAVSAEHLRAGAAAWERSTAALEGAQSYRQQPSPNALRPELLAMLLWSVPHLLARPPPAFWLVRAEAATQAALRYSSAANAAAAAAATADANAAGSTAAPAATPPGSVSTQALGPRTLAMLLQGWARLQRPPAEGVLFDALLFIADAASTAVAGGGRITAAASGTVGPQHVVIVLWSCAVMGLGTPVALVQRLTCLHADLLLLPSRPDLLSLRNQDLAAVAAGSASPSAPTSRPVSLSGATGSAAQDVVLGTATGSGAATYVAASGGDDACGGGTGSGNTQREQQREQEQQRLRQALLARELLERQAELGMLVWALITLGVSTPPEWLPAVLAAVGGTLERDAATAAAAAAVTATAAGDTPTSPEAATALAAGSAPVEVARGGEAAPPARAHASFSQPQQQPNHPPAPPSSVTLLTVKTLARACLAWRVSPGERWVAAATACLDAGALGTKLRRAYGRTNLEAEVRYLLEQLHADGDVAVGGALGPAGRRRQGESAAAWAEAAGGAVLTNAMAAVAAGSAAAWMQGLVW